LLVPGRSAAANTALGSGALFFDTTGANNTATGDNALFGNTIGSSNTANGLAALSENTTGNFNTASGDSALFANNADNNTATGYQALFSNQSGTENTATGVSALKNNAASDNTATGFEALFSNTTGTSNTATGANALHGNTTGGFNTAAGLNALTSNTIGSENTANGAAALTGNTTGKNNTATGEGALLANKTGSNNTATGLSALQSNTAGNKNTADGVEALLINIGNLNTACGYFALINNTTGSNNIAFGANAGFNLTTGSNNIDIGNQGVAGESAKIRIGKQGTQNGTFIAGIHGVTVANALQIVIDVNGRLGTVGSSERFKEAIKSMDKASEAILALKPVTFRYKEELDPDKIPQFGLVAEDVEKVNPDLVIRGEDGKVMTVRYDAVNAMLLNEFLKEHTKVQAQALKQQELEATIVLQQKDFQGSVGKLEATIAALTATVKEQASLIQNVSDQLRANRSASQLVQSASVMVRCRPINWYKVHSDELLSAFLELERTLL
jgi:trimeric autotransporter adhesin